MIFYIMNETKEKQTSIDDACLKLGDQFIYNIKKNLLET